MKAIWRILNFLVMWVPIGLIGGWGVSYVVNCAMVISAPGTNLTVPLETEAGPVTITAETYFLDIGEGVFKAYGIRAVDGKGVELARAKSAFVHAPGFLEIHKSRVKIDVDGAFLPVIRENDGTIPLLAYFKPAAPPEKPIAITATIKSSEIKFIDRMNGGTYVQRLRIPRLNVDTADNALRAIGEIHNPNGGYLDLVVHSPKPDFFSVDVEGYDFEVGSTFNRLVSLPEAKGWGDASQLSTDSMRVTGPIRVEFGKDVAPRLESQAVVVSKGFRAPWWDRPMDGALEGRVTESGLEGKLSAHDALGSKGAFEGWVDWRARAVLSGRATFAINRLSEIPNRFIKDIPKGLIVSEPTFDGVADWTDGGPPSLRGQATAWDIVFEKERVVAPTASLVLHQNRLTARLNGGTWSGDALHGGVSVMVDGTGLSGFVRSDNVDVAPLVARYSKQNVAGTASLAAIVSGSLQKPSVVLRAKGRGSVDPYKDGQRHFAGFDLDGALKGDDFYINRLTLLTANAVASATGSVNVKSGKLNVDLATGGVEIAEWVKDAKGMATAKIALRGTIEDPTAKGRIELFGGELKGQSAPIIVGNITAKSERVIVEGLSGLRGASRLDGSVTVNLKDKSLTGHLEGASLQLSDFVKDDASGKFSISGAVIGGTLDAPTFSAQVRGERLVVSKVRLDQARAFVRYRDDVLSVEEALIETGEGSASGSASYHVSTARGDFKAIVQNLPLERFVPLLPGDTLLDGTIGGDLEASIIDGRLTSVLAKGTVRSLKLNPTLIGNGAFEASFDGDEWQAKGSIGQLERYIEVPSLRFNAETEIVQGQLISVDMPIRDLYFAVRSKLQPDNVERKTGTTQVPATLMETLDRLQGALDVSVAFEGNWRDPSATIEEIGLRRLNYAGEAMGDMSVKATREPGGHWRLLAAKWSGGPGAMTASGTFDEDGEIDLDGEINKLDPQKLAIFNEKLASITGEATIAFTAKGPKDSPVIVASADASLFEKLGPDGKPTESAFAFSLGPITIREGQIDVVGDFSYLGVAGKVDGKVPFHYPASVAEKDPMDLSLRVSRRSIAELDRLLTGLDLKVTKGDIEGAVVVSGLVDDLSLTGFVSAELSPLAFRGAKTRFTDVDIQGVFKNDVATLDLKAKEGEKGKVEAHAEMAIPNLAEAAENGFENVLNTAIKGRVVARDIAVDEAFGVGGQVKLAADGQISISGPLRSPLIQSTFPIVVKSLDAMMPTEFGEPAPAGDPPIKPRFNIGFAVARRTAPARVRAATANFDMYGLGTIKGTMAAPNVVSSFTVRDGAIRLPNARIALEEGGSVRFVYDGANAGPEAMRLDVDLDGRTNLSYVRYGGLVQRYDVTLQIRGNLFNAESQLITGQSDPPDLSQAQIINLLGQSQIFESLGAQFLGQRNERAFGSAIASAAIPVLFDPFTQNLAQGLGLEYLTLEYNAFEGPTVALAKVLGKGLIFQGRRQLSETIENKIMFDYRLTWRPPIKERTLRNVIVSFGADQDRPWKLSIEYGIRF